MAQRGETRIFSPKIGDSIVKNGRKTGVYFGRSVPFVLKYTLRMASDLTPYGWGTLLFNMGPLWPKMAKNGPKMKYPRFPTFFQ